MQRVRLEGLDRVSRGLCLVKVLAMCLMMSRSLSAQIVVEQGMRVRISIREQPNRSESPLSRRQVLRGDVAQLRNDTLFLRPAQNTGELPITFSAITSVHRSKGTPSRWANGLAKGAGAAIVGAVYLGITYSQTRDYGVINRGEAIALGAGAGFVTGMTFGVLFPVERWQPAVLPGR